MNSRPAITDAPAPALALLVVGVVLAFWPGLEQPGKTPRDALLLLGAPLVLAVGLWSWRRVPT